MRGVSSVVGWPGCRRDEVREAITGATRSGGQGVTRWSGGGQEARMWPGGQEVARRPGGGQVARCRR